MERSAFAYFGSGVIKKYAYEIFIVFPFAYLSAEAAAYLANIPIKCLVTDGLSVESFTEAGKRLSAGKNNAEEIIPVHYHFLSRGIPVVEQVVNAPALIGKQHAYFIGFPLKVKDGDGSPVRAAAFVY